MTLPRRTHRVPCFTLIELMLVVALLALVVGMTVVRLDGISAAGRLRSAARQIGAVYRTARVAAMTDGRPRLVSYQDTAEQGTRLRIQRPSLNHGTVEWQSGEGFRLTGEVRVRAVVRDGRVEDLHEGEVGIWLSSSGIARPHVAILALAGKPRAAVVMDGVTGEDRFVFIEDPEVFDPQALLEPGIETTGNHAH